MSMRSVGIYEQGAIFRSEDFDPVKVILAVSEKIMGISLPDDIKDSLVHDTFNPQTAIRLCELLEIDPADIKELTDYSRISNYLVNEAGFNDWFDGSNSLMGSKEVSVSVFSNISGEFMYDCCDNMDELVEDCFMFVIDFPFAWKIGDYQGLRTKPDVLHHISETAKSLLKDDIDWEKRLGALIGATIA